MGLPVCRVGWSILGPGKLTAPMGRLTVVDLAHGRG